MSPIESQETTSLSVGGPSYPPAKMELSLSFLPRTNSSSSDVTGQTLLSEYEIQLSRKLKISPNQFHNLKTVLLVELNTGQFNRNQNRSEQERGVINSHLV
uniref:Uncharacterized protein n=1 Tax=Cacopsylla melanoneura TaxID=428564 RepID=A0A8D8QN95_9HEMI